MAVALVDLNQLDKSREQARYILNLDPGFSIKTWSAGLKFKDTSWNRRLEQSLLEAGLPE